MSIWLNCISIVSQFWSISLSIPGNSQFHYQFSIINSILNSTLNFISISFSISLSIPFSIPHSIPFSIRYSIPYQFHILNSILNSFSISSQFFSIRYQFHINSRPKPIQFLVINLINSTLNCRNWVQAAHLLRTATL